MEFLNSVGGFGILRLEQTIALLASLLASLIVYLPTLLIGRTAFYTSYSIFVGRLLKENLFFKENNALKPKTRLFLYLFICNMVFDIITNILFIFLFKYSFYLYFIKGYSALKFVTFFSVIKYYFSLDDKYYKKEQESKEYVETSIKKILETNPNFFNNSEPFVQDYIEPKRVILYRVTMYFSVIVFLNLLRSPYF